MQVNQAQLAELLGKTVATISNWTREGMPVAKRGTQGQQYLYETTDVFVWLQNRWQDTRPDSDLETERTRKVRVEADLAELELAKARGDLVPTAEVEKVWVDRVTRMKSKLRGVPTRSATQLVMMDSVPQVEALLLDMIDEALNELANDD